MGKGALRKCKRSGSRLGGKNEYRSQEAREDQ